MTSEEKINQVMEMLKTLTTLSSSEMLILKHDLKEIAHLATGEGIKALADKIGGTKEQ